MTTLRAQAPRFCPHLCGLSDDANERRDGLIRRFVVFHGKRHPTELGEANLEAFLTALAVDGKVAAPTQIGFGRFA